MILWCHERSQSIVMSPSAPSLVQVLKAGCSKDFFVILSPVPIAKLVCFQPGHGISSAMSLGLDLIELIWECQVLANKSRIMLRYHKLNKEEMLSQSWLNRREHLGLMFAWSCCVQCRGSPIAVPMIDILISNVFLMPFCLIRIAAEHPPLVGGSWLSYDQWSP